ncbi:MAG: glycosyltransferase, partial [Bacteroidales bacterium]|nr:glycosyltransferase [Bacteroidales bacterium]
MAKILMVVNEDRFFLSHRVPVALAARDSGHEVKIVAKDTGQLDEIRKLGFEVTDLPIHPTGMNPLKEQKTFRFLRSLYKRERPDIVHHVGLKNILWGGLAAKLTKVPGVVDAVSGLGGLFNGGGSGPVARAVLDVIAYNHKRPGVRVIFQNDEDKGIFLGHKAVEEEQIRFTKGSGIDLDKFKYTPEPQEGPMRVIFTARMVKEKGITDLIEAAEMLKDEYKGRAQFLLCGRLADNASAISEEYFREHCDGDYIQWLGLRSDVKELLERSAIMAFPSYYREGVPKSLIEASAVGRPIVTCDSVGCRDVVDDGVN